MTLLELVYTFFIGPLELFFEVLYTLAYKVIGNAGIAIIFLSLAMNFLVLPLYRRADTLQEEQRDRALTMKPWTDHIKKTFSGDERFLIQQTYNRQMEYKPTDIFKGSVSLLLEVPFFIAAYHFLSHLEMLRGVPFGPIADLGTPDALIQLGKFAINFLPLLMTAINIVAAIIYLKGFPLSSKLQTYGIAAIFLLLLYNSPAGLVFYWTLNNLFSLAKNIVLKVSNNRKARVQKNRNFTTRTEATRAQPDLVSFTIGCVFLVLLIGIVIPLAVIQASPSEFIDTTAYTSPLWFIAYTFTLALGTFGLWFGVFYRLVTPRVKKVFEFLVFFLSANALVNYLFFGNNYGTMDNYLKYNTFPDFNLPLIVGNTVLTAVPAVILFVLFRRVQKLPRVAYTCLTLAVGTMALFNIAHVAHEIDEVRTTITENEQVQSELPSIELSKDGNNVVVIMLDRAVPDLVPYLVHEKPELKEMLSGFKVYSNAISFGAHTNLGAPAIFGGPDYRPLQMNMRDSVTIVQKHDEALKVMPLLFGENGYDVTVFDPPYAGYSWYPDLSVFNAVPRTKAYRTMDGRFLPEELQSDEYKARAYREQRRNFFCYSLFRVSPTALQPLLYENGAYNSSAPLTQIYDTPSRARGYSMNFMNAYSVLEKMPYITHTTQKNALASSTAQANNPAHKKPGKVLIMANDTTHEPAILSEPEYEPTKNVNNKTFDTQHPQRCDSAGRCLELFEGESQGAIYNNVTFYQDNMAALLKIGQWCEHLKTEGIYNNTRIILVSDHSWPYLFDEEFYIAAPTPDSDIDTLYDMRAFHCLLMVKDYNATDFTFDDSFMTTADVPALAFEDLISNPTNPFTGNAIDFSYKQEEKQYVQDGSEWNIYLNNGTTFLPDNWFSVGTNTRDPSSWQYDGLH